MAELSRKMVTFMFTYGDVTPHQAQAVRRLLAGHDGRENAFTVLARINFHEQSGTLMVSGDLQEGVTVADVEEAIRRNLQDEPLIASR